MASCAEGPRETTIALAPGAAYSHRLAGGRLHRFQFEAPADRFLHLIVEQRGVDVVVLLEDPSGRLLFEIDTLNGKSGPERVLAVTPAGGVYTLAVEPLVPGQEGEIELQVRAVRPASREDRLRAEAAAGFARAERRRLGGDFEQAVPLYREALPILDALGERGEAAAARWHLGESLRETGELEQAVAVLEDAAARFRELGNPVGEARALNNLGVAWRLIDEPGRAFAAHEQALGLYRGAGNEAGEAAALNDIALVLQTRGDFQGAIDRYGEALVLWRRLGRRSSEATTLQNLGSLYTMIGHDEEGWDLLQRSLRLVEGTEARERVSILIEVGWARYVAGRPEEALDFYRRALPLARHQGNRLAEAGAWDRQGSALVALRRYEEASASYLRALEICRAARSFGYQAHTLANLGWLELETGEIGPARRHLREALALFRASGDPNGEIFARVGLSRAERRLGALGPAREQAETAVRLVEEMRAGLRGSLSRGSFLATRYGAFEELVALLLDLDRREPAKGHAREALEVAERARALNLLEELDADQGSLSRGAGEELDVDQGSLSRGAGEGRGGGTGRRQILQAELRALDARRDSLAAESPRDPRLRVLDAELRKRSLELDRLAPSRAGPPGFHPLAAAGIQDLLDEDSVLLVYLLAEPSSFAWTVDRDGVEVHHLPGSRRIGRLARQVVAALSQKSQIASRATSARAAEELSEAVLGPLLGRLDGRRRLVLLPDGALHLVPFAALPLPVPGGGAEPLLVRHEIVLLPSATFLAGQRRRLAAREPAPGAVAVLADPVFSLDDDRLTRAAGGGAPSRGYAPGPLQRLPYTAREAEAVVRLARGGETLLALGEDAHRDLVTSGALGRFRVVHFATHGLLHPVLPERSGIVLSRFDGRGRQRDGFLAAPDVAGLDLPAELVVLSACQTGLGREMRGEGLVGLTQAFFRAGARRVVVSHWSVQDRATAELMARFYRALFEEGLSPSAALRQAQLSIRSEERWRSPWYWAGFSLHGDWR